MKAPTVVFSRRLGILKERRRVSLLKGYTIAIGLMPVTAKKASERLPEKKRPGCEGKQGEWFMTRMNLGGL